MSPTMGEEVALWSWRGPLIVDAMTKMFQSCALIGVVENDKPRYLLRELCLKNPDMDIGCVHVIKGAYQKTNAYKFNLIKSAAWGEDRGRFEHTATIRNTNKEDEYDRVTTAYNSRHESKEDPCGLDDDGLSIYYDRNRVKLMGNAFSQISETTCGADMAQTNNCFFTWSFQLCTTTGKTPSVFKARDERTNVSTCRL